MQQALLSLLCAVIIIIKYKEDKGQRQGIILYYTIVHK